MKLYDLLDKEKLDHHIREGFVGVQRHPALSLRIYNYTHLAQYDGKAWGDGTIDYCRGLIVDNEDNIVARPLKKFHNLNTASIPETCEGSLPDSLPEITQKMDGSLGIWYPDGTPEGAIATRGSFTSPQAQWATKWWKLNTGGDKRQTGIWGGWEKVWTPLFEIIYPENRIVVDYKGFKGLVCIGGVYLRSGLDVPRGEVAHVFGDILVPKIYISHKDMIGALASHNSPNEEGYVASWDHGRLRVKIKFEDYVKLHRIITGMNARTLWGLCKCGTLGIGDFPEHIRPWAVSWSDKLHREYFEIQREAYKIFNNRPKAEIMGNPRIYRKECADYFFRQKGKEHLKSLFFLLMDGRTKDVREAVWGMIEPRGDDRSFQPRDVEEASV